MSTLPALTAKQVVRALEKAGFSFVRQKGSHRIYVSDATSVTVPYHTGDLRRGTIYKIIKQAGFIPEEFVKLL